MRPVRESSAFMAPAEETDNTVFDDCWVSPMSLDNENWPTLPDSIFANSMLGFDPQCMGPPTSPARAVLYNQDQYSVDYSYAMHDYYHNIPPPLFQPSLYATDTSGFSGDPNNSSSHHSCGIPTVTSFPNFRMNLGTGTLLPSVTNAPSPYQAQQHPCETCPRVFGRKKDLKRHMVTVHATGQELVYRCRCGKSDIRKDNHRRHIRTCNKKNEGLGFFCKCLEKYEDEEMYLSHVALCPNPSSARE